MMPLSGLTVLDLSRFLPGPLTAAFLGDYGASVIRIERPDHRKRREEALGLDRLSGDALQRARDADWAARNKATRLVDYSLPKGRDEVLALAETADVLIHDYREAAIRSVGLCAGAVRERNPSLIYVAISATGQTGTRAGAPGHDPISLALAGVISRTGENPGFLGFPPGDIVTASQTAFAIMVALHRREKTGEGATLDAAMTDGALSLMTSVFTRMQRSGRVPPLAFDIGDNAVFETRDGRHVVATNMERPFWDRFCAVVGRPDLVGRFTGTERAATLAELGTVYASRTRDEWDELARKHDLQIAPVLSPEEALNEEHHHARGALRRLDNGIVVPGRPVRFTDFPQVQAQNGTMTNEEVAR